MIPSGIRPTFLGLESAAWAISTLSRAGVTGMQVMGTNIPMRHRAELAG